MKPILQLKNKYDVSNNHCGSS